MGWLIHNTETQYSGMYIHKKYESVKYKTLFKCHSPQFMSKPFYI